MKEHTLKEVQAVCTELDARLSVKPAADRGWAAILTRNSDRKVAAAAAPDVDEAFERAARIMRAS